MHRRVRWRRIHRAGFALAVWLLAACTSQSSPTPVAPPSPTSPAAGAPSAAPTAAATPGGHTTLAWWTPDFLSPDAAQPGGALLDQQLRDFTTATDDAVRVQAATRARYGKGGLLDYLRTAGPVAPGILPDVIALDIAEVEQAAALGLLQPLDGLLDEDTLGRLYPAARTAGEFNGQRFAVPLALDLEHIIYNRGEIGNPPSTWTGLLTSDEAYLFPLGSPAGAARSGAGGGVQPATLSHYLGSGYTLDPATRRLALEEEPLARVLRFYADARAQGKLAERPEDLVSLDAARQMYVEGARAILQMNARRFLADRQNLQDWTAAGIPGWANTSPPVVSGWALAIVTPDPERQRRAAELIAWLVDPQRNGHYTRAAGWLPVSQEALAMWPEDDYRTLLGEQLQAAVAPPAGGDSAAAMNRLQEAVLAVMRDGIAPEQAARQALAPTP